MRKNDKYNKMGRACQEDGKKTVNKYIWKECNKVNAK